MRYFIHLCFDGTNYHGWQRQKNAGTIQSRLEGALSGLLGENISVTGCGRTDSGVHARSFYAHVDIHALTKIADPFKAINAVLPEDIAVLDVIGVDQEAHCRYSATGRTYQYMITRKRDPFLINKAWYFNRPLDLDEMNTAAGQMLGEHDFKCFCKTGGQTATTLCTVSEAGWHQKEDVLVFTVSANRFLRNMVRAMVGTLIDVGLKKMSIDAFGTLLAKGSRSDAGASVPACGLYLHEVSYPDGLLIA